MLTPPVTPHVTPRLIEQPFSRTFYRLVRDRQRDHVDPGLAPIPAASERGEVSRDRIPNSPKIGVGPARIAARTDHPPTTPERYQRHTVAAARNRSSTLPAGIHDVSRIAYEPFSSHTVPAARAGTLRGRRLPHVDREPSSRASGPFFSVLRERNRRVGTYGSGAPGGHRSKVYSQIHYP